MPLDLTDCQFSGPALPEPFVKFELERELTKRKLLAKTTGSDGKQLKERWEVYRRKLRSLAASGGALRVRNHVIEPLVELLGYATFEDTPDVQTREDREAGGVLLVTDDGATRLRVWTTPFNEDLFAPSKRGRAYRFSHLRIAQRVLLTTGERVGLLTNGVDLMLLISDPARPDSTVTIPLNAGWKRSRDVPDSFRFLLAMASPGGLEAIPEIVDRARLGQARVTKELRKQARRAVRRFIQEILDHPENREWFERQSGRETLARDLWREGLITVYRLLFLLKLEASDDAARSFTFASTSLWRNTFSPSMALAGYAHDVLERGVETGRLLESGLRSLFRMFEQGLECTELNVKPLGGSLFGEHVTPTLSQLAWGERAVAHLLDQLLWTTPQRRGKDAQRERVHYGPLDVEDLGRVYEALLELEPGIASEPMCRLKRQKLEVVVPLAQGETYRPVKDTGRDPDEEDDSDEEETPASGRGKKTKVEWIEEIPPGQFYLRVGLGRKSSGSYYTPHSFVRFLVQETLGPQVAERCPEDDPRPLEILHLKVLDPAMGSGHFLVEACRFLGEKLYEACRLCDEKALAAERRAEKVKKSETEALHEEARQWRQRVIDLPDPEDELLKYLPSRSPEGEESGLSQQRAIALCRRLVATHCLYGVDKNPLAVELAKLALWLESHAEGMPLTFLDHRLVLGDSLTGPFWEHLLKRPSKPEESFEAGVFRGIETCFKEALFSALRHVKRLEAGVGATVAENAEKNAAKHALDEALLPIRLVAAAWSGGVMLGPQHCDDAAYLELLKHVAVHREPSARIESEPLRKMIARGLGVDEIPADRAKLYQLIDSGHCVPALAYDLAFPEVFYPNAVPHARQGFHAVLGNPPWDAIQFKANELLASYDLAILSGTGDRERHEVRDRVLQDERVRTHYFAVEEEVTGAKRAYDSLYEYQKIIIDGDLAGRQLDAFRVFVERGTQCLGSRGVLGMVLPGGFHANEGASGIRQLTLLTLVPQHVFSFVNRRKYFDISPGQRFDLVTTRKGGREQSTLALAFDLEDDTWLFADQQPGRLSYPLSMIRQSGEYATPFQLSTQDDIDVFQTIEARSCSWSSYEKETGLRMKSRPDVLDANRDAWRFETTASCWNGQGDPRLPESLVALVAKGFVPLHEKGTIDQYNDRCQEAPRYCVALSRLSDRTYTAENARYFRLIARAAIHSSEPHKAVFAVIPPGGLAAHSTIMDCQADSHRASVTLELAGIANSMTFDYYAHALSRSAKVLSHLVCHW